MEGTKRIIQLILNLILPIIAVFAILYLGGKLIVLFLPFFIGWVISLLANPIVRFLEKRLKIMRKAGSAIVIVAVIGLVAFACYGLVAGVAGEVIKFSKDVPAMMEAAKEEYGELAENVGQFVDRLPEDTQGMLREIVANVGTYVSEAVANIGKSGIVDKAGEIAANVPDILAGIIFGLLASYFFITEKDRVDNIVKRIIPDGVKKKMYHLKTDLFDVIIGYFKAQLKIMVIIYVIVAVGLAFLQVPHAFIWSFFIAFLDMLPIFGTGTVLWPWMVIEILSGDWKMTIGLLVVYIVSQLTHQLIQPKLIGDSIGLNPFATLFFMYVGYLLKGVFGMIIAIPIGMILVKMFKTGTFDTMVYSGKELGRIVMDFLRLEAPKEKK